MLGNLGQLASLLKNAGQMKQNLEEMNQRLEAARFVGEAGGGQVSATASATGAPSPSAGGSGSTSASAAASASLGAGGSASESASASMVYFVVMPQPRSSPVVHQCSGSP